MQKLKLEKLKSLDKRHVYSWRPKVLTESTRRSGDGSLFHARGEATANERSLSDDVVQGTVTEPNVADLRLGLAVAAAHLMETKIHCTVKMIDFREKKTRKDSNVWLFPLADWVDWQHGICQMGRLVRRPGGPLHQTLK